MKSILSTRQYKYRWPKKPIFWKMSNTLFISVPFTWNLPKLHSMIESIWKKNNKCKIKIGGPATTILPNFFSEIDFVEVGGDIDGVLQRVNPLATKTSLGCIRKCKFCAIGSRNLEGPFIELEKWPDLPILIDNNILATSTKHFDKVIDKLKKHSWADFNAALDLRLLNEYHAKRVAEIQDPLCRLAFDNDGMETLFEKGYNLLRSVGIPNSRIQVYCLTGFNTSPDVIWKRCEWISKFGVWVHPTWFHEIDQLKFNQISEKQSKIGWTRENKTKLFQHFWNHGLNRFGESFSKSKIEIF